jgi:hypothetical protein
VSSRGACGVCPEPSQHLHHLRNRQKQRAIAHRYGVFDGETLKHRIGAKPMDSETVLALGIKMGDALNAAHCKE